MKDGSVDNEKYGEDGPEGMDGAHDEDMEDVHEGTEDSHEKGGHSGSSSMHMKKKKPIQSGCGG